MTDSPDLDFIYDDADSHGNEIAELYSYTEDLEFLWNKTAFEELMEQYGYPKKWNGLATSQKEEIILRLLDVIEVSQRNTRMHAVRAILYLLQGAFGECMTLDQQPRIARENVFFLYKAGVFHTFVQLLNMEVENSSAATSALRKPAVSLGDSTDLRVILSVLYTFVEVMRVSSESDTDEILRLAENFQNELSQPMFGDELLAVTLFQMVTRFCSGSAPHFPIKKVLLLLWKVILWCLTEMSVPQTPVEILYQAILPNLPQYMIALLKILLAAAPTSKAKTESINIMADVLPEEMPMTVLQSMKLGIDVNRHKEIIVKTVSGILLLLLKHFKINHIYQFEYMSQQLMFANCIPLVLKFFNQNIMSYVGAKNMISVIDFPACVVGEQPELTAEVLEMGEQLPYCWRNLFSCINLLRVLNKLTKWKHSRIMMLVVFKSAPILKRALKVKHAMMQLYVLKLLKMQTKYLGRQWRKSNMKTMSAIYQKVRHRLNDDWAYGNDLDARPWDFQAEEFALQASINRFHNRRYDKSGGSSDPDFQPVDNNFLSVLGREIELTEEFKQHYESWVNREVFQTNIDWDQLLNYNYL
ncbi:striatin-interacting protein 1-like [Centruroides sculpturatus]|uniref:striatin-interacting protein 1-like n=2 Tax=Centruroides sculpturatus TaxID=218467 RepID=UPI000C6DF8BA|nr:striatin-interacting protein 1-like [Centruroides sculpturatus]